MGFRNPPKSAAAVDTGAGRIPGVKIYSKQTNPGAGVVEWDAYSAKVTGELDSSQTGSGGTFFTLGGPGYPSLGLNLEEQPAGGTTPFVRFTNAGTVDLGGARLTGLGAGSLDDTGWINCGSLGAGYTVGTDGARYRKLGGLVTFQFHALGTGAGNLFLLPTAFRPTVVHWWIPEWAGGACGELKLTPDGWFAVSARNGSAGFVVSGAFAAG